MEEKENKLVTDPNDIDEYYNRLRRHIDDENRIFSLKLKSIFCDPKPYSEQRTEIFKTDGEPIATDVEQHYEEVSQETDLKLAKSRKTKKEFKE